MAEEHLSVLEIQLDPENPRLDPEDHDKDQAELLELFARRYKLEELGASIVEAGFIDRDPIICFRRNGGVFVREGNRRVAALKLLTDPSQAPARLQRTWTQLAAELDDNKRATFERIRVDIYDDPDAVEISSYVGFRHVSGVLEWPAAEKARYIATLINRNNWPYERVARLLGNRPSHIQRHYVALQLKEQSVEQDIEGSDRIMFGNLLRALQAPAIREFLSLEFSDNPLDNQRPVPEDRVEELKTFIWAMFGTDERDPLIRDSREITKLSRVLQSEEAVNYIRTAERPSLERAWIRAGGQEESVADILNAAANNLEDAVATARDHSDSDEVRSALRRAAQRLEQILRDFPDIREEFFRD